MSDYEDEEVERIVNGQSKVPREVPREVGSYNPEHGLLKRLAALLAARYHGERRRSVSTDYNDEPARLFGREREIVKDSAPDQYMYDGAQSPMYLIRKWYEDFPRNY